MNFKEFVWVFICRLYFNFRLFLEGTGWNEWYARSTRINWRERTPWTCRSLRTSRTSRTSGKVFIKRMKLRTNLHYTTAMGTLFMKLQENIYKYSYLSTTMLNNDVYHTVVCKNKIKALI